MSKFPKAQAYEMPVAKLLPCGDVRGIEKWLDYEAEYGITAVHIPDLICMIQDEGLHQADSEESEVWAPLHAWRALGQLKAVEAIKPIVKLFHRLDNNDGSGDWEQDELPVVLSMIGPATLPNLTTYLGNPRHGEWGRVASANTIMKIGKQYPDYREKCVGILENQLAKYRKQAPYLNASLISDLVELRAVEAADTIAAAFKMNKVALSLRRDWEEIQIELGLLDERITPKTAYGWFNQGVNPLTPLDDGTETAVSPPLKKKNIFKKKLSRKAKKKKRRR